MVQKELTKVLEFVKSVKKSDKGDVWLSQDEKDDLYEAILEVKLDEKDEQFGTQDLKDLFNVTKEVLKYKGEQVEALVADLDVLAAAQPGSEDIRDEIVKLNRQTETLVEELQNKERELDVEKSQVEKLLSDIAELQKEKSELRREILLIQSEGGGGALAESEETEDPAQLKESIQTKNRHILQLLSDIAVIEKDNETLTTKYNSTRKELNEATNNLTKLSGENISLRQANYEFQEKLTTLEERNTGLTSQVAELVQERNKREIHLDQLIDDLEDRVSKWQEIFGMKEKEIAELRARLKEASEGESPRPMSSSLFATNYAVLSKTIEEQEEMIEGLKEQLKRAGEDLNKSSAEMQQFKKKVEREEEGVGENTLEEMKEELEKLRNQVTFLQDKAKDAEEDAQFRAEEMTELMIQLREFEDGVYGLSDAFKEIKELKLQITVRDRQIRGLVQQLNQLGLKETFPLNDTEEALNQGEISSEADLRTQLHQIQETAINLSVQNFDLRATVMRLKEELSVKEEHKPEEDEKYKEFEEKLTLIVEENEALRKGLHEVLESIHQHDGEAQVAIESETLEKVLEALDCRHVSGWYHPAMRLQAALNKLQGNNEGLRAQLRESRFRESYFQAELQSAYLKLGEMEDKLDKIEKVPPVPAPRVKPRIVPTREVDSGEIISTEIRDTDPAVDIERLDSVEEKKTASLSTQTDLNVAPVSTQTEELTPQPSRQGSPKHSDNSDGAKPTLSRQSSVRSDKTYSLNGFKDSELQRRCEDLKTEIESMKESTRKALEEMNKSKMDLFQEVQETMKKIIGEVDSVKKAPRQVQISSSSELAMKAYQAQEAKMVSYGLELTELRKCLYGKESIITAMEGRIKELEKLGNKPAPTPREESDKRVIALKETVMSLQQIIRQKEEVVERYQKLLEENNAEYEKLQLKYKQLETASSPGNKAAIADSHAVSVLMEKWLTRVHNLEDEIRDLSSQLSSTLTALEISKKETEKWKEEAQKAQERISDEPEKELQRKEREIEELKITVKDLKAQSETELRSKLRAETTKLRKKEEKFKAKEKELEAEISRLKHATSLRTTKASSRSVKKEYVLMDRIKQLEQELEASIGREKTNSQLRRDKVADEVSKWEDRKRLQTTNEKLKSDVKEKSAQVELLEGQVSRLKQIIARMERERITLQRRLKISEGMLAKTVLKDTDIDEREFMTESRLSTRSQAVSQSSEDQKTKELSRKDLIKAITALKKVVTKLRNENSNYVHKSYAEQLQQDLRKMEENYMDAVERSLALEESLREAELKLCGSTYTIEGGADDPQRSFLKEQLAQKCELLGKVKVLLQRAMAREKQLIQQVTLLEKLVPPEKLMVLRSEERIP